MTLKPYTIERFGGLNLAGDPLEVGTAGAVDASNVLVDRAGALRTRPGLSQITNAVTNANYMVRLTDYASSIDQTVIVDTDGGNVYVRNTNTGASVTSSAITVYGATATSTGAGTVYFPSNSGLYKWTGGGSITLAVTSSDAKGTLSASWQGRLVIARTNAGLNEHRVQFSNVDAPETLGSTDWVELDKGDGDAIRALVTWRDNLFVFKRNKFYVFYGTGVDADGGVIFNYRRVATGIGVSSASSSNSQLACAAPDGVYFAGPDGVYVTAGEAPVKVSQALDPWYASEDLDQTTSLITGFTPKSLSYSLGKVFFSVGSDPTPVYDIASGTWTVYSLVISKAIDLLGSGAAKTLMVTTTGLHKHYEGYDDDNGSAITWSWKSAKYPLSDPGYVAVTTESNLVGTGTVTVRLDSDLYTNQSGSVTLGSAPTPAEGWLSKDQEGTWLQHTLSGSGRATVSRLTHYLSSVKPAGVR